jgi:hypothetical protein
MAQPVTLIGISLKGKNRVREHGDQWVAVRFTDSAQCFNGDKAVQLESVDTGHRRWVRMHGDKDFTLSG